MFAYQTSRATKTVAALLSATAICALATPAFAQSHYETSDGDIDYSTDYLEGYPLALVLQSTGGNVITSVDLIQGYIGTGQYGDVVNLRAGGEGSIDATFGDIYSIGDGYVRGVYALTDTGTIDISVDRMAMEGAFSFGILAIGGGSVNISAGDVSIYGTEVDWDVTGLTSDGLLAISYDGDATVTANIVDVAGLYTTTAAAVTYGAGDAVVDLFRAESSGTQGGVIYAGARGGGDAYLTVEEVVITGVDNSAASAVAEDGSVFVTVGSIDAGANSNSGIYARATETINIAAGSIETDDYAINATGTGGFAPEVNVLIADRATSNANVAIQLSGAAIDLMLADDSYVASMTGNSVVLNATSILVTNEGEIAGFGDDTVALTANSGAGPINIVSEMVTANGVSGVGILATSNAGDISIDANVTQAIGEGLGQTQTADAIIARSNTGNVSIVSNYASTSGYGGSAIVGQSAQGNVSIVSNEVVTTGNGGIAFYAASGNNVSVDSESITMAGDGRALFAEATNAVDVRVGSVTAENAIGILARAGGSTSLVVDGNVATGGYGAAALSTGFAMATINGTVDSATLFGVAVVGDQGSDMTVSEGASITGATNGAILATMAGGQSVLFNRGTVTGGTQYAVLFDGEGEAVLVNDGTLVGGELGAVLGTVSDDIVLTSETSRIVGVVDLSDGIDTLRLSQSETGVAATGEVAQTVNVEILEVVDGSFRASMGASAYETVDVADGAELIVAIDANGSSVTAANVVTDGRLVVDVAADTTATILDLTTAPLTGAGTLVMSGSGVFAIDDGAALMQEGGVAVESGTVALADTAVYDGLVTTSGSGTFAVGEGDFTGDLVNNGNFVVTRDADYVFSGDFSGTGSFEKNGDSTIVFSGVYAFEGLTTVNGGSVALAGAVDPTTEVNLDAGTLDLSMVEGGEATISLLEGDGGTLVLGETDLTIEQAENSVFVGDISGDGTLTKDGAGKLDLTGDVSFTGDAVVVEGTFAVNGDMSDATFFIEAGGRLGGNGTVGDVNVEGGTIGAGNSIGHLVVDGDLLLDAASTFEVEVNAVGDADLVEVTGMADLGGSTLAVLAEDGSYAPLTTYTILTAAGGVSGEFGDATSNLAFLTPVVTYNANDVLLTMARNDIDFVDLAGSDNQAAIAGLISELGFTSPLYYQTLLLSEGNVATDFETLTGEDYPALSSAMVEATAMLSHQFAPSALKADGLFGWGKGLVNSTSADAADGYAAADLDGTGIAGGIGYAKAGLAVSLGAGRSWQDSDAFDLDGLDMTLYGANLSFARAGVRVAAGAMFGNGDGTLSRKTSLGSIVETVEGGVDANVSAFYVEASYGFALGGATVAPYAGLSQVSVDIDDVAETGGVTALSVRGLDRDVTFGDVGLRVEAGIGIGGWVKAQAGLRQAWGDRDASSSVAFANSDRATIVGMPIAKSAVRLGLEAGFASGPLTLSVGYDGTLSDRFDSHGGKVGLSFSF